MEQPPLTRGATTPTGDVIRLLNNIVAAIVGYTSQGVFRTLPTEHNNHYIDKQILIQCILAHKIIQVSLQVCHFT